MSLFFFSPQAGAADLLLLLLPDSVLPKLEFSPAPWQDSKRIVCGRAGSAVHHHSVVLPSAAILKLLLFLLPFARFGFLFSLKGLYRSSFSAFSLAQYVQRNVRMVKPRCLSQQRALLAPLFRETRHKLLSRFLTTVRRPWGVRMQLQPGSLTCTSKS